MSVTLLQITKCSVVAYFIIAVPYSKLFEVCLYTRSIDDIQLLKVHHQLHGFLKIRCKIKPIWTWYLTCKPVFTYSLEVFSLDTFNLIFFKEEHQSPIGFALNFSLKKKKLVEQIEDHKNDSALKPVLLMSHFFEQLDDNP